jgi:glutathione S-transferase
MSDPTLVIGNKSYSSWSLRPWLLLRQVGIPFTEIRIPLYTPESRRRIAEFSPSGHVPVLLDGALAVWDSLAICEYVAERFPESRGWPGAAPARAVARSVSAEMHSGFRSLRNELHMNVRARRSGVLPSSSARAEIDRVCEICATRRARFGRAARSFGRFGIADAMFAPVVTRFATYGVDLTGAERDYAEAVRALPALREWIAAARAETEVIAAFEHGEPRD